jgi:hypothetical protein
VVSSNTMPGSAFAALRQFARKRANVEKCEMCSRELAAEHQHLLEPTSRKMVCACEACAILFSAGAGLRYKRIPRDVRFLRDFRLTDAQWDGLMIPIEMAFLFFSTPHGKTMAYYPSPAGATESLLSLETWNDVVAENPVLQQLQPDVEALLVNRVGSSRGVEPEFYGVPIDKCFELVGLIRVHWRGLSGGTEVWKEVGQFFAEMKRRAGVPAEPPVLDALTGEAHA